jgi:hypothetical protein
MSQWNLMVPAFDTVIVAVLPGWMCPVSNDLSSAVTVWAVVSVFFTVIEAPTFTVIGAPKLKLWIVIASLLALAFEAGTAPLLLEPHAPKAKANATVIAASAQSLVARLITSPVSSRRPSVTERLRNETDGWMT